VTAPPGTPHSFGNPTDEPAEMLCTITPDLYVDYFRDLARLPSGGRNLNPDAIAEIMAKYATEVVPSPPKAD
jgi:hypothetical protein